jgi:hypothetical protein
MQLGEKANHWLQSNCTHLWLVVDTASSSDLYPWLMAQSFDMYSLYSGLDATLLAEVAPYLIKVGPSPAVQQLIVQSWGEARLIFIESEASAEALRIQLKKNLIVKLANGKDGYFRFYDPRALRSFIGATNFDQLDHLFGSAIRRIHIEQDSGTSIMTTEKKETGSFSKLVLGNQYLITFTDLDS